MTVSPQRNAAAIGAFALGGLLLVVAAIVMFGATDLFVTPSRAVIYFDRSVAGLQTGSPVTYRGVPVGSVERIAVKVNSQTFQTVTSVFVVLRPSDLIVDGKNTRDLNDGVAELVARGLRATLELQSLITGQLYVDLSLAPEAVSGPAQVSLDDLPVIPVVRSDLEALQAELSALKIAELAALAQRVLTRFDGLTEELQLVVSAAQTEIRDTGQGVQNAADATASFARASEASVRAIEGELTATLVELRDLLSAGKAEISGIGTTVARINETAESIEDVARNLNSMLDPNAATHRHLESALRDLAATASALKEFARQIERNPNALILGTDQ